MELNSKCGFIDKKGNLIIPFVYDGSFSFSEGLAVVEMNGKDGFIDKKGNLIIPCIYEGAFSFSEGFASVKLNGKYGFIDRTGKVIIPFKYDGVIYNDFFEELTQKKIGDNYGYKDEKGYCTFFGKKYYFIFSKGLARVKINGKDGLIDKKWC